MAGMYGYESSISEGSAFNARTTNYNEAVQAHNQILTDKYNAKIKAQPGKLATDKTKKEEDEAFYGLSDGKGVLGSTIGLVSAANEISDKGGLMAYAADSTTSRLNTIGKTASRLGEMTTKKAQAALKPSEVDADGKVAAGTEEAADDAGKAAAEAGAVGAADDATKAAAKAASVEIESSGLGTSILKQGLKKVAGGAVSEAGLSVASEIGGKVAGDFGGIVDIGEGIDNLADGKKFFAGDDKTAEIGDTLTSVGAVADVVGTVFPPAELIGGALGAVGGIFDAYDSIKKDLDKKKSDGTTIPPPVIKSTKVTPAFSAMGLVASAPISAKAQIVGG